MNVEIVTIGDELLLGFTVDTNAVHLARELAAVGVEVVRRATVGDEAEQIASAVGEALERTGAVITTGGLGPTADDRTKASIAVLFGRGMRLDEAILAGLRDRWAARGWPGELPAANREQAMLPEGARVLVNRHGSAPGVWIEDERGSWVAMLPGVPREMRGMTGDELIPMLQSRAGGAAASVVRSRTLRTTGIAESALADRLGDIARAVDGMNVASLPGFEGTDLRITSRGLAAAAADAALDAGVQRLRERAGSFVYGEGADDLATVVLDACRDRQLTIAVAESCTGGLLGGRLTAIPGSSDVVLGGVIAYSNAVKERLLGVPHEVIAEHGAVSEPVVLAMAAGARAALDADVGIAITGIAGPGGGTAEKPVGTVWVAVDVRGRSRAVRPMIVGDRDEIRRRAAQGALDLARRAVADMER
jgi:nicotinamide-nucleotide amidase